MNKAFRVPSTVKKPNGSEVKLKKSHTQTNQESNINVISVELIRLVDLPLQLLSKIKFKNLSIRIADHRDTVLEH